MTSTRRDTPPAPTRRHDSRRQFGWDGSGSDSPASPVTPTARRPASLRLQSTVEDETHPAARAASAPALDPPRQCALIMISGVKTVRTAGLHMCTQSLPWVLWTISHAQNVENLGLGLTSKASNRREPPRRRVSPPPSHIAVVCERGSRLPFDLMLLDGLCERYVKLVSRLERRDMSSRKPAAAE